MTDQQLAAAELHRDMFRRAIAEAGGWDYNSLEPHDFQGETTAVLAIAQMFIDGYQDNIRTLLIESEQRLGELLFWEFEYREAMDNYKGEAAHAKSLRTERDRLLAFADWAARNTYPLTEIHTAALTAIDSPTTRAALADLAQVASASADAPVPPWLVTHTGAPAAAPARPVRQTGRDTDQDH